MNRLVCDAIGARRLLRFVYEGYERIVEPHLHGINAASHEALSAWIVEGWSASARSFVRRHRLRARNGRGCGAAPRSPRDRAGASRRAFDGLDRFRVRRRKAPGLRSERLDHCASLLRRLCDRGRTLRPVVAELESGGGFLAFFERFAPEMPDSIRPGGSAEMVAASNRSMLIGVMRTFPGLGPGLEGVAAVGVPATVVVGSIDTLRVEAQALARSWTGSRYVEVEGADHVDVFWHPATLAAVREQMDSPAERR